MNIPYSFDHTGFPLLHLFDLGCYVHLLPITKAQFARYAGVHEYTHTIYEAACRINPLDPDAPAQTVRLENHLMTGILPEEAAHFAAWISEAGEHGAVFKLPSVPEWRAIYAALQYELCRPIADRICEDCANPDAADLIRRVLETRRPHTLLELSLMHGGVIEWAGDENAWKGLGCPRTDFFPNTFDPLHDAFEPVDPERRMKAFGFRLIRTFR